MSGKHYELTFTLGFFTTGSTYSRASSVFIFFTSLSSSLPSCSQTSYRPDIRGSTTALPCSVGGTPRRSLRAFWRSLDFSSLESFNFRDLTESEGLTREWMAGTAERCRRICKNRSGFLSFCTRFWTVGWIT